MSVGKVGCFILNFDSGFGCLRAGVFIWAARGRSNVINGHLYRFCTDEARIPCEMDREIMQIAA